MHLFKCLGCVFSAVSQSWNYVWTGAHWRKKWVTFVELLLPTFARVSFLYMPPDFQTPIKLLFSWFNKISKQEMLTQQYDISALQRQMAIYGSTAWFWIKCGTKHRQSKTVKIYRVGVIIKKPIGWYSNVEKTLLLFFSVFLSVFIFYQTLLLDPTSCLTPCENKLYHVH